MRRGISDPIRLFSLLGYLDFLRLISEVKFVLTQIIRVFANDFYL